MGKIYRTVDLLKNAYDGEIFKNKFRNVKTGKEIEQGKTSPINFFYVDTHENIFNIASNFVTIDVNKILKQEWEEVQEPVTFMDAVKSGKLVKVKHEIIQDAVDETNCDYVSPYVYNSLDDLLFVLSNNLDTEELRKVILEGKWYIREGD